MSNTKTNLSAKERKAARDIATRLITGLSAVEAYDVDYGNAQELAHTARTAWMLANNPKAVSDDRLKAVLKRQRVAVIFRGESEEVVALMGRWVKSS